MHARSYLSRTELSTLGIVLASTNILDKSSSVDADGALLSAHAVRSASVESIVLVQILRNRKIRLNFLKLLI